MEESFINSERWLSLDDLDGEYWTSLDVHKGTLYVSNFGRVKSPERITTYRKLSGMLCRVPHKAEILRWHNNGHGYYNVTFRGKKHYIHRLVAEAFIPNLFSWPEVDHINCVRWDNRVENLRWVTKTENCNNPITDARHWEAGEARQTPIVELTANGEFVKEWSGISATARAYNCPVSVIFDCLTRRRSAKTFKGRIFVYKEDYNPAKDYSISYKRCTSLRKDVVSETGIVNIVEGNITQYFATVKDVADYYGQNEWKVNEWLLRIERGQPVGVRKTPIIPLSLRRYRTLSEEQRRYVKDNLAVIVV